MLVVGYWMIDAGFQIQDLRLLKCSSHNVIPALSRNPFFMKTYFAYILASKKNGTLYIGMTNDLVRRVYEHKSGLIEGFTKKYSIDKLVYYESTTNVNEAILREKRLKKWKRQWKIELIEKSNPDWRDLSENF
jgi:putative endonuclease